MLYARGGKILLFVMFIYSSLTWTLVNGSDGSDLSSYSGDQIGARSYASVSTRMINNEVYIFGGLGFNDFSQDGVGTLHLCL